MNHKLLRLGEAVDIDNGIAAANRALERLRGTRVRIVKGKYAGRTAIIDGLILCLYRNEPLYLCMVERADGTDVLNSDGESRRYRTQDEFELLT